MINEKIISLKKMANKIRMDTFNSVIAASSGHLGGSLSIIEILTVLYFDVMDLNEMKNEKERDKLVLSKGHGVPALYATLANKGIIDKELLNTLRDINSPLQGHPDCRKTKGLDVSSGSLGQGLSTGLGIALAQKLSKLHYRTFVILGDGEINEGQVWEAAMFAAHYKVCNLIAILDVNKLQLDGATNKVISLGDISRKWKAFGWNTIAVDGHSIEDLCYKFNTIPNNGPTIIIADTIKGKGISFMENNVEYHGKIPNDHEVLIARKEIEEEGNMWSI